MSAKPGKRSAKTRPDLKHEAERLRRLNAPLDTSWYVRAGELAKRLGVQPGVVLEFFAELAHRYTYDGTAPTDAEARAWHDTVEILGAIHGRRERVAA